MDRTNDDSLDPPATGRQPSSCPTGDIGQAAPLAIPPLPPALLSTNPWRWLSCFGPGAIIASLTIGTGELIFSSRGGALFGYRILFLFAVICLCKWILAFSMARHMVVSGVHPLERWNQLRLGPAGWLPSLLLLMAALCIPIWMSFHASVLGDLLANLTGTRTWWNGASVHAWGLLTLGGVFAMAWAGGYSALERVQLTIVICMLIAMLVALALLRPDGWQMLYGLCVPQPLHYPDWLRVDPREAMRNIAQNSEWVEATLYVGVIGGGGYDYLAYTSFLRDKGWGLASVDSHTAIVPAQHGILRQWVRAPFMDCTLSFLAVVLFSGVFVASGAILLGPQHQLPSDQSFLEHQAQFVTRVHPWLYPLYAVGVLLTILGTLYGTLEVAPTIFRESLRALSIGSTVHANALRRISLIWCVIYTALVLLICFWYQIQSGSARPPGLTQILIPANLFTGVLLCGLLCLGNPWIDRQLPRDLRPSWLLTLGNLAAGSLFFCLGIKGTWDSHGVNGLLILLGTTGLGWLLAAVWHRGSRPSSPSS